MITWGVISALTMFITTPTMFYVMRFLLGAAEAGFFPGIILYLTYWFPGTRRAKMVALFMTAIAISNVIGSPVSGAIMQYMDGMHGWRGWQTCSKLVPIRCTSPTHMSPSTRPWIVRFSPNAPGMNFA